MNYARYMTCVDDDLVDPGPPQPRPQRSREHRARRRGAGARRTASSGDSGDDGPGEPPPATAALAALAVLLVLPLLAADGSQRKKPSQLQRVLDALRRAGERGVVTVDFLAPTIDGREPILRLPSRIDELRQRGHAIETVQKRPVARYVLRRDAEASREDPADPRDESRVDAKPEPEQSQLVDAPTASSNPYDPTSEWS